MESYEAQILVWFRPAQQRSEPLVDRGDQNFPVKYASKLDADETVIWWSRGSGTTLNLAVVMIFLLTAVLVGCAFALVLLTGASLALTFHDGLIMGVILVPAVIAAYMYFQAASNEVYVLTEHRVIAFQNWMPLIGRSVVKQSDHRWRPPIKRIVVTGCAAKGSVRLRGL